MQSGFITFVALAITAVGAAPAHAQSGVRKVEFKKQLNAGRDTLTGFVDLHTHPVNHISFGGKVFHGAPDVGIWMPKDMRGCGTPAGFARTRDEALSDCASTHKVVASGCGNVWRGLGVWALEDENNAKHEHGKPAFTAGDTLWPMHDDITHQQMWVDWMERAYHGGLRVMVALVTNNQMLGDGVRGTNTDDPSTLKRAIPEIERLAGRHRWMEVAYSPADVRRIVGEDRMAVILGAELDDIGGMVADARKGKRATDAQVRAHIRALHATGVRYVFPLHVVDNTFGGTAAYRSAFDLANRYIAGFFWSLACTKGYGFQHDVKALPKLASALTLKMDLSERAVEEECKAGWGHVNRRGLTRRGEIAIDEMMRLGMIIDVDHMSHAAIDDTIAIARAFHGGYPLVSGHSSLLDNSDAGNDPQGYAKHEDKKLARHYQAIRELGGMVGIEWDSTSAVADAKHFVEEAGRIMKYAGNAIAFGTDINGMVVQPRKPEREVVTYSPAFPRSKLGSREWDYNKEGMAHYGLLVDFLKDVERVGRLAVRTELVITGDTGAAAPGARTQVSGEDVIDALFAGAESFAVTWERAAAAAAVARRAPAERLPADVRELPARLIGPLCPTEHRGDREFNGNGPEFHARADLKIVDAGDAGTLKLSPGVTLGESALVARIFFEAKETRGGNTHAKQHWDIVLARAPRGSRFERILGPSSAAFGEVRGISGGGGFQFIVARNPPPAIWMTPDRGKAVDEFIIVGDTGGLDISNDADCRDDTSVTVALNPIRVKVAPIAERSVDAVDVRITTGNDDIRGDLRAAFVRIDYVGGQSAEIDVTALGKGGGASGTIRVPLGRSVKVADLRTLRVRHVSNQCFACTTDHWAVASVTVSAAGVGTLLSVSGFDIAHTTKSFAFP